MPWQAGAPTILDQRQPPSWRRPAPRVGASAVAPEWVMPVAADTLAFVCTHVVDDIKHLLTTPSGQVWVGYFDEAPGGPGPFGVAQFDRDLGEVWRCQSGMPDHFDCYALNVRGEAATSYAYTAFHLTRLGEGAWRDLGRAPHRSAHTLLIQGQQAALIGGSPAEYDLVVPLHLDAEGITQAGPLQRLVLPDGLEVSGAKFFGRGADLHAIHRTGWHRLDLSDLTWH